MARRKKRGSSGTRNFVIIALAIVFIGGGLIFVLPSLDSSLDITTIFQPKGELNSSVEFFSLPAIPELELVSIAGTVDCSARFTLVAINQNGQIIETINSPVSKSGLFIDLAIVDRGKTTTSANIIKEYRVTPKIKCDSVAVTTQGANIGYFLPHPQQIAFVVAMDAPNGSTIRIGTFSTTKFSHGDMGDNFERFMPTVTIPASLIDAKAPTFSTRYDSEVGITMGGQLTFGAISGGVVFPQEYPYFIGLGTNVHVNHLITVDKVDAPPTQGEQTITINAIDRLSDRKTLLTLQTKINSLTDDVREATLDVTASLRGWQDVNFNEARPTMRILECLDTSCDTSRAVTGSVTLIRQFNGDTFRAGIQVPQGATAGSYAVEVKSTDRSQVALRGFDVEQVTVACPDPKESLVGGVCVPIIQPVCGSGFTGIYPNCTAIPETCADTGKVGTFPNCTTATTCEDQGQVGTFPNCSDEMTPITECASGESGTPPNCVKDEVETTGGAKGKIEYTSNFLNPLEGGGGSCVDTGSIPTTGVDIQAFQLISGTGKCAGNKFVSIDIRPIIDFGSQTVNVDKGSVMSIGEIWVSVNNPFPATPVWGTEDNPTCEITSAQLPQSCIISNHDFDTGTSKSSFTARQFAPVTQLRSGTGIYDIALITLSSAEIEKKVIDAGFQLRDGDEYSFLVQFVTKFSATIGNSQIDGVIPAIALHYTFNYAEGVDTSCDLTTSFLEETKTTLASGEEQITFQCKPRESDTCPKAGEERDPITNTCLPPKPPDDPCPATQIESPVGSGNCITPKPDVCDEVPTCSATEKLDVTGTTDDCGFEILQCVPKIGMQGDGCADGEIKNTQGQCVPKTPDVVPPNPNGGCDPFYVINAFGNCQRIGSGTEGNGGGGGGTDDEVNFCQFGSEGFNFSQCLSSIFSGDAEGLMIGGTTQTAILVVGMIAILVIIIAVIIRKRRGRGFSP